MAVESASRDPRNILMVDDRYTVLYDGHVPPDQRDVERLPDTGLSRLLRRWIQEAIHSTRVMAIGLGHGIGFHLDLVAASQENSAVGARSAIELDMQLEIFELRGADEVGAIAILNQCAVLRLPGTFLALVTRSPAS